MEAVETECNHIFRYNNSLHPKLCKKLSDFMEVEKNLSKSHIKDKMPWEENDNFYWLHLDKDLKTIVFNHRSLITQKVNECFNTCVLPVHTDLILWRAGKRQRLHKDNGYSENDSIFLRTRKFTSITYLNDNFVGGETFIRKDEKSFFKNVPLTGSTIIFPANETGEHGVYKIISGHRITLGMWFSDEIHLSEENRFEKYF